MRALTTRQQEVLDFIQAFHARKGYAPTLREIGGALGMRSSSAVHRHLSILRDKGHLNHPPGAVRAVAVVRSGAQAPAPLAVTACRMALAALRRGNVEAAMRALEEVEEDEEGGMLSTRGA